MKLFDQYFEKFKPKEFNDTKILYFFGHSSAIFHTKKPVHNLEELRGVKIRAAGVLPGFVSLMGAVPVSMPMGRLTRRWRRAPPKELSHPMKPWRDSG